MNGAVKEKMEHTHILPKIYIWKKGGKAPQVPFKDHCFVLFCSQLFPGYCVPAMHPFPGITSALATFAFQQLSLKMLTTILFSFHQMLTSLSFSVVPSFRCLCQQGASSAIRAALHAHHPHVARDLYRERGHVLPVFSVLGL